VALRIAAVELLLLTAATAGGTALIRLFPPAQAGSQPSRLLYLLGYELPAHISAVNLALH
jgi:hypothetical protein